MTTPEAFLLLTLPGTTLKTPIFTRTGTLGLECVTVPTSQDVYLVLRMDSTEIPIDPYRVIVFELTHAGSRVYTFCPTDIDPDELVVTIPLPNYVHAAFLEDVETFESILDQYAEFRGPGTDTPSDRAPSPLGYGKLPEHISISGSKVDVKAPDDLHGHLVLVNQDNGEIVGQFDDKFRVREDSSLSKDGQEKGPVVIEIPEDAGSEGSALEVFARTVPADQHDWITNSATIVR